MEQEVMGLSWKDGRCSGQRRESQLAIPEELRGWCAIGMTVVLCDRN